METLTCIKTRRSRRRFIIKKVPREIIDKIIEAGKTAPSSHDCQPWQFYVIQDQSLKDAYAKLDYDENKEAILTSDFILAVCVDVAKSPVRYVEDGVLASQNMSLAIHDLGLGSVYLSANKKDDLTKEKNIQRIFEIPEDHKPICLLCVGYPDTHEELPAKSLPDNKDLLTYR